jgi:hypothetical protein
MEENRSWTILDPKWNFTFSPPRLAQPLRPGARTGSAPVRDERELEAPRRGRSVDGRVLLTLRPFRGRHFA